MYLELRKKSLKNREIYGQNRHNLMQKSPVCDIILVKHTSDRRCLAA